MVSFQSCSVSYPLGILAVPIMHNVLHDFLSFCSRCSAQNARELRLSVEAFGFHLIVLNNFLNLTGMSAIVFNRNLDEIKTILKSIVKNKYSQVVIKLRRLNME